MKLDKLFAQNKLKEARSEAQSLKGRETLVYMSPRDFLKLAPEVHASSRSDELVDLIDQGVEFRDIPYLKTDPESDTLFKVVGHEGRHRSLAILKKNIKGDIPVRIIDLTTRWLEDGYVKKTITLEAQTGSFRTKVKINP